MERLNLQKTRIACRQYGHELPQKGREEVWQFVNGQLRMFAPPEENLAGPSGVWGFAWFREKSCRWRTLSSERLSRALWGLTGFAERQLVPLPFQGPTAPRVYIQPHLRATWSLGGVLVGSFDLAWSCDVGRKNPWVGEAFVRYPDDLMRLAESVMMRHGDGLDLLEAVADFCVDYPEIQRLRRVVQAHQERVLE